MLNQNHDVIIVRYGELSTKGKNRSQFVKQLHRNIKNRLFEYPQIEIQSTYNRIYMKLHDANTQEVVDRLKTVYGISTFSVAHRCEKDLDALGQLSLDLLAQQDAKTFKVETKRRDKRFGESSDNVNRSIATHILKNSEFKVDVRQPDVRIKVEIDEAFAYVMAKTYDGAHGYPVGVQGKAMMLLSGGIDSPVAAAMAMKRGLRLEFIHFASMPYTSQNALDKVVEIAKKLSAYQSHIRIHIINFTECQMDIYAKADESYAITLMRRYMVRMAEALAEKTNCKAIVTGESLGQVASQTIESMAVIEKAIDTLVIRPLITYDKVEIVSIAKEMDTYNISILPFEDCCTIFTPQNPVTRPRLDKVERYESRMDTQHWVNKAMSDFNVIDVDIKQDEDLF